MAIIKVHFYIVIFPFYIFFIPHFSFALLTCEVILLERILYLLTSIQHKYRQTKNEMFIYLNVLDLGPIYTVSIKKRIINKLSVYLKYLQYKYLSLPTDMSLHHIKLLLRKYNYNHIH